MASPQLLDLFCGAGGAAMGYHWAGFKITGVDLMPQKRYPFAFIQGDALEYLIAHGHEYDVIHTSPPCQAYSVLKHFSNGTHPDLIGTTRALLQRIERPWVIENVPGAPLWRPLLLCGSMFGLQTSCGAQLRRHRLFESNMLLMSPGSCQHHTGTISVNGHEFRSEASRYAERKARVITVTGSTPQQNVVKNIIRETFSVAEARLAMGIDWMVMKELSQAIPPAYTEWIGGQLLQHLAWMESHYA